MLHSCLQPEKEDWLGDMNDRLVGFPWRAGTKRETTGTRVECKQTWSSVSCEGAAPAACGVFGGGGGGYQQCDWSIISSFTMYLLTMSFGCHLAGEVSALLC